MMKIYKKRLWLDRDGPIRLALKQVFTDYFDRAKLGLRIRAAAIKRNRSNAVFVGVTGSSAKSTTSALLAHVLASQGTVQSQIIQNSIKAIRTELMKVQTGLDYFVAEVAVGQKGHAKAVSQFLQPDLAIVTMVGIEHYSWYRSREAVAAEKGYLVEAIKPGGTAILNADDEHVMAMASRTKERIVTFGRSAKADYRVVSTKVSHPGGLTVEVAWKGGTASLRTCFIGEQFWLSTVAVFAAARELSVPVDAIAEQIASFTGVRGRCEVYRTRSGPCFILDTAKAPNETLALAFDMLKSFDGVHKRIVLGDISDYPGNPYPKYRDAYRAARAVADQVIFVGNSSHRSKASAEDRENGMFLAFVTPKQVFDYLKSSSRKNEIILLKGSQNLHLERIALGWDRHVQCWEPECRKRVDCHECGLYGHPFAAHQEILQVLKPHTFSGRTDI